MITVIFVARRSKSARRTRRLGMSDRSRRIRPTRHLGSSAARISSLYEMISGKSTSTHCRAAGSPRRYGRESSPSCEIDNEVCPVLNLTQNELVKQVCTGRPCPFLSVSAGESVSNVEPTLTS